MILLSTGSLRGYGLNRVFGIAGDAGYDGIELIIDDHLDTIHTRYLNELADGEGIPIRAVHAPFFFLTPPGWPESSVGKAERAVSIAEETGADVLVLHMPCLTEDDYRSWIGKGVEELQGQTEVTIAVENMPCAMKPLGRLGAWLNIDAFYYIKRSQLFYRMLSLISAPVFNMNGWDDLLSFKHVVLDTTHMATGGYDLFDVYRMLNHRIVHFHLSNFDGREHISLDQGILPMGSFIKRLGEDGYAGYITLEFMPEHIGAEDQLKAREVISRNLRFVRGNLAAGRAKAGIIRKTGNTGKSREEQGSARNIREKQGRAGKSREERGRAITREAINFP